jgi:hypothetical protein
MCSTLSSPGAILNDIVTSGGMIMNRPLRIFLHWLPLGAAVTLIFFAMYVAVQQVFRMMADEPQAQMAHDAALRLAAGSDAQAEVGTQPVEISSMLGAYLIVFNAQNQVIASGAQLHGQAPAVPPGVLDAARQKGENRVTWQPEPGVRSATVEAAVGDGRVVLAGRSLKESEAHTGQMGVMLLAGWLVTMVVTLVLAIPRAML